MANPRYALQDSGNLHDNKLGLALQFANLGLEQQGQADREHSAKVASAIQLLGLIQQGQQDQARNQQAADLLGYHREVDARQGSQFDQKLAADEAARADASGQFWGGTLPARYSEIDAQNKHYDDQSGQFWGGTLPMEYDRSNRLQQGQDQQHQISMLHEISGATLGGQPLNPLVLALLRKYDPQIGALYDQQAGEDQAARMNKLGFNPDGSPKGMGVKGQQAPTPSPHATPAGPQISPSSVTGAVNAQPTGNFNSQVDPIQMLGLLRQNDPSTAKAFDVLNGVRPPGGQGSAYEGSPMYNKKKQEYDDATRKRASMLAPYLFKLYGSQPINLNQA